MTRKDYETIAVCFAQEMRASDDDATPAVCYSLANRIAVELEMDNPRFDRDRFMAACEVQA